MWKNNRTIDREIRLPFKIKKSVLALGSSTKNTVCFATGSSAYVSRVHCDLGRPRDLDLFEEDARFFLKKYPRIIASDLHPDYVSTKYACQICSSERPTTKDQRPTAYGRICTIQHHHAHIAACMAENGSSGGPVIGVAFDGTGLGDDNTLWGAEFLVCDYRAFQRRAHLRGVTLIGGDAAIRQPWRMGAAWLDIAYPEKFFSLKIPFVEKLNKRKWRVLKKMSELSLNSVMASSAGRLWDAAASIIINDHGLHNEAELAMELEKMAEIASGKRNTPYRFSIVKKTDGYIIDPAPIFKGIVDDIIKKTEPASIAYRFHLSAALMIKRMCLILRREYNINRVALSGGVFQNSLLLSLASGLLYKEDFEVFTHKKLSCNDSGVSLGQAVIAGVRG